MPILCRQRRKLMALCALQHTLSTMSSKRHVTLGRTRRARGDYGNANGAARATPLALPS